MTDRRPPSRVLILVVGLAFAVAALGRDDSATRAAERVRALDKIRSDIARLQAKLEGLETRESSLAGRLERTTTELSLQEERLAEAAAERAWADQRLTDTGERVAALEAQLVAVRDDLARRLDGIYRLGRGGYLRLALSLNDDAPLLPAMRQLRLLARRDRDALEDFRQTRDDLGHQQRQLEVEQHDAQKWEAEESTRRADLDRVRREQADLLERVARERRSVADRTAVLREQAQRLTTLISALVEGNHAPLDGRPITGFKGVLDWPVEAEVDVPFGPRRDPRYKTEVPHNGVDLTTRSGDQVRTVYPGTVLFAGPVEGFGETVVVHHPGQVFSLYAGLRLTRVGKDDVLGSEAVIGTARDTLYFEIRHQNQPEDPLGWLRAPTLR